MHKYDEDEEETSACLHSETRLKHKRFAVAKTSMLMRVILESKNDDDRIHSVIDRM